MNEIILQKIKGKLIVSCQARKGWAMYGPDVMSDFAVAAKEGGASAIRATGAENIRAIKSKVDLPIIGINKVFTESAVYITPTYASAKEILDVGVDIIAIDATRRKRPNDEKVEDIITEIRKNYPEVMIMGEISTLDEAKDAIKCGFDLLSTTLVGYTEESKECISVNFKLISELSKITDIPIICEGRIKNPQDAKQALVAGAFAVVVGTSITRPEIITKRFVDALNDCSYISFDETSKYINNCVNDNKIPGCSISFVTKNGFKCNAYGYAALVPEKEELKNGMKYDLASLTKVVATTTLALICIEKGLFNLKTKVKDILNDFPFEDITILSLLTHTSGLVHDDKSYRKCKTKDELIKFIYGLDLEYETGTKVVYSDFGFIILGLIIEKVLGKLDESAKKYIFDPLNMNDTLYKPSINQKAQCIPTEMMDDRGLVRGIVHDGKAYRMGGISGNAGLFSTIEDLSKFAMMILNNGVLYGNRVLSVDSINLLKKSYTEGLNLNRTLGWFSSEKTVSIGDYYSDKIIYHTGFTGTSIYIDFERECGIIILTNRVHPTRCNQNINKIRDDIHNLLLKSFDNGKEDY